MCEAQTGPSSASAGTAIFLQELEAACRENEHSMLLPGFGAGVGSDVHREHTLWQIKRALFPSESLPRVKGRTKAFQCMKH